MAIAITVIVIILLVPVFIFNGLVIRRNRVKNTFGTTDALLKKRFDLIPNLVSTVKGYMEHEKSLLQKITDLRAQAFSGTISSSQKIELDTQLSQALVSIMASVENYPDLKASDNFMHLQRTLNELEEQISAGRRAYNAAVTDYNNAVETFPGNIVASMFNFTQSKLFEITDTERENVNVGNKLNS